MDSNNIFLWCWEILFPTIYNFFAYIGVFATTKFRDFMTWLTGSDHLNSDIDLDTYRIGGEWHNPFSGVDVEYYITSPLSWIKKIPVVHWFTLPLRFVFWALDDFVSTLIPDLYNYPTWLGLIVYCTTAIIIIKFFSMIFSFISGFVGFAASGIRSLF